jgi:hypothetical protein
MGKTIFAAVLAALVTSLVTVLVMDSMQAAVDAQARQLADETAKVERDRLERRVAEVERRAAAPRADRRTAGDPPPAPADGAAAPPPLAPDGTPYVSRAELETFAKQKGAALVREAMAAPLPKPVEKKSLEDIAREQGLSAGEEANLRNILRDSEEELVHSLFGDTPIDDVKRQLLEAKADPDKRAVLTQSVIQNGIANFGKITTLEERTKKKVEGVLGPERAAKFNAVPHKSVIAPEFEDLLKGSFEAKAETK